MPNNPMPSEITDIIYDIAIVDQTIYLARQSGLYRSDDAGLNWSNSFKDWMPDESIPSLSIGLSPNFESDKTVLAGINGGVVLSTDGGVTWFLHQFRMPVPMVTSIALSPTFANDRIILAGTYEDGMFRSDDAGKSWQAFNFGLFDHNILCLALSPQFHVDHIVYAGTSTGIYKSINGGRLWQDLSLANDDDAVLSLAISADGGLFAGTESSGLYKSIDGGMTWTSVYETESAINSILLGANHKLLAQFDDGVMDSDDDGMTWTSIIDQDVNLIVLSEDKQSIIAGLADTSIQTINLANL